MPRRRGELSVRGQMREACGTPWGHSWLAHQATGPLEGLTDDRGCGTLAWPQKHKSRLRFPNLY